MKIASTPWGRPDHIEEIHPEIAEVLTPSHGGIVISERLAGFIPASIKPYSGSRRFWEEDNDWAVPYLIFGRLMAKWGPARHNGPEKMLEIAHRSIAYQPGAYEAAVLASGRFNRAEGLKINEPGPTE